jgi:uncharacterized protein
VTGATDPDHRVGRAARRTLLSLARESIRSQIERGSFPTPPPTGEALLDAPSGAFVSLHIDGALRGCIGSLEPHLALRRTIAEMAVAAATEDHRFAPLSLAELRHTEIEISVLSPLLPIAPDDVEVGRHGLYVIRGRQRGVLLPQVPVQYRWSRERFLAETCRKAGLPTKAWRDAETQVLGFTAEVFSEYDLLDEPEL